MLTNEPTLVNLHRGAANYPGRLLTLLDDQAPSNVQVLGDERMLTQVDSGALRSLAILASTSCSDSIKNSCLNFIHRISDSGVVLLGGFHSPVEKCCLEAALKENLRIVIWLARSLNPSRLPPSWLRGVISGQLVIVSAHNQGQKRPTIATAQFRNRCVAAMSDSVLIIHAKAQGKTEALCHEISSWNKPLFKLDSGLSALLLRLGVRLEQRDETKAQSAT